MSPLLRPALGAGDPDEDERGARATNQLGGAADRERDSKLVSVGAFCEAWGDGLIVNLAHKLYYFVWGGGERNYYGFTAPV